jgi:glycine/D-amino acid oxidase-like deaminating enzyme
LPLKVIISGFGLAGATLALQLLERGAEVYIYDAELPSNASKVAAGVYNPIIPKRMSLTWMAEQLIPYGREFYNIFQEKYHIQIHRSLPVFTVFDSVQQQNEAAAKYTDLKFSSWLLNTQKVHDVINQPYGGQWFQGSGAVDTKAFLKAVLAIQHPECHYRGEHFFHAEVIEGPEKYIYRDLEVDYIICCEGHQQQVSPVFTGIKLAPAKGELLVVRIPEVRLDYIIQSGIYMLPLHDDLYTCGATYEWDDLNDIPTEGGRTELLKKISNVLNVVPEVVSHWAGVRPASQDRRPILGMHPVRKRWGIFNGLGTKGVLLAPYFSAMMANHIIFGAPIIPEVSVMRYFK